VSDTSTDTLSPGPSPDELGRLDAACDRFEAAWQEGRRPRIEDELEGVSTPARAGLIRDLLVLELAYRRRAGERPSPNDYGSRFPDDREAAAEAFRVAAEHPRTRPRRRSVTAPEADRNLLFGILALQMDFISRDDLIAAMHAWVLAKQTPLGRILVARGFLSPARHALLDALVLEHIKQHDDDPEKSLANLSSIGPVRRDLEAIADPDVQASLPHVCSARGTGEDPDATPGWSGGAPTSAGGRFRILRLHDRGGLGEIFVARDEELHRDVALKRIQERHADNSQSRSRFVVEAEITGGLEHPGIIPVYGLGHFDDGRPFYAMRFVRGASLKEAIQQFHVAEGPGHDASERSLALRRLIGRFLDVCNAVAYAHSRGVLHRDLKPGNVMLGPYGETLVVDWGLAKVIGRPEGSSEAGEATLRPSADSSVVATRPGSFIGTPAYMSPEQARGDVDRLGPASDVYSLGATLYQLLTGRTAFEPADFTIMQNRIIRGEFPPPRQVNRGVPAALEAVSLKAMALKPEDRYSAPRALADDLEHWLADQPVSAWREPWTVRARRWMRRHRTLVTTTAAVWVFGLVGLVGFAAVLTGKNRELDIRNQELDRQRHRAEEREALAVEAVRKFRDAVQANPELKNRPELDALRTALLNEPLAFFRTLRDQLQADRDTRPAALGRLANADIDLATTTAEIGSIPDAIRSCAEAIAIWERLARENPAITDFQRDLANSHDHLAKLLSQTGHPDEAIESQQRALAILQRLARDHPTVTDLQRDLANSHSHLGVLLGETGHPNEAIESQQRALAILQRLARDHPTVTDLQRDLARSHGNLGNRLSETGHPDEAMESYRRAVEIQERLARDHPTVTELQRDLATSHSNIGVLLGETGHPDGALTSYRRALEIQERLARDHPTVTELQGALAWSHGNIGAVLYSTGHLDEALASFRRILEILERLVREHPSIPKYRSHLGGTMNNIALIEKNQGRWREARQWLERAIEHQRAALSFVPRHPVYGQFLRNHLSNLTGVHQALNQPAEAIRTAREFATLVRGSPAGLYEAACLLALSVPLTRGEDRQALAAEAVQTLREAVAAGWSDAGHAARDPDLAPLRDHADLHRLMAELFDRGFPADPFAR
jgi:serine/threonine-protein kinase